MALDFTSLTHVYFVVSLDMFILELKVIDVRARNLVLWKRLNTETDPKNWNLPKMKFFEPFPFFLKKFSEIPQI